MGELKLGINLWSQASDWSSFLEAGRRADRLGYDHVWTWDHLWAIFGDPHQPIFEGYTALAGLAAATQHVRLGLFVGANPMRNPGLAVKSVTTIDHISDGRAMMGMGAAWFDDEHKAFGIEFGSGFGERLDWLAEAIPAARTLLDGGEVTSAAGSHYAFDHLRIAPLPVQAHLPILIGGSGEQKTLRIVARHADMWNVMGALDKVAHKVAVLEERCAEVDRDPSTIERTLACKVTIRSTEAEARRARDQILEQNQTPPDRVEDDASFWTGTPEQIAERMLAFRELGFDTFIAELPAPYDAESLESLITEVKPMVERMAVA